jgi:hypothetical protein
MSLRWREIWPPRWLMQAIDHNLWYPVLVSAAAGGLAYFAFEGEHENWRRVFAVLAILLSASYLLVLWRTFQPPQPGPQTRRTLRFYLLMLTSLAAIASGLVGIAVLLGWWISDQTEPLDVRWMYVGSIGLGLVLVFLFAWWARSFYFFFKPHRLSWWESLGIGVVVLVPLVIMLSAREIPRETIVGDVAEAREAGAGRYDLLLVVDPGDPMGRQLIRAARREGSSLFPAATRTEVQYKVAYGLAVPRRGSGRGRLWRLVEPPTEDLQEVADSLARIKTGASSGSAANRVSPAATSYGRLLYDTMDNSLVRWRPAARRGVAFMLQNLPSVEEMNARIAARGSFVQPRRTLVAGAQPGDRTCGPYLGPSYRPSPPSTPTMEVAWRDAVVEQCKRLIKYRQWRDDHRRNANPGEPVALHVLTRQRGPLVPRWWYWSDALGGRFDRPGNPTPKALLEDAMLAHTGQPLGGLAELAKSFRPHLMFDHDETMRPIDADWLLREGIHQVCDRKSREEDNCEPILDAGSLLGSLDEYIKFAGTGYRGLNRAGAGAPNQPSKRSPDRMYVHVREKAGRLYLGYWWFLPFNVSPWRSDVNCLPGFTFGGLTCHDHDGDWEGVTVELSLLRASLTSGRYRFSNVKPEAVLYDSHGKPTRWNWDNVKLDADDGSYATHPVVFSASGSHASYPAGCADTECDQSLRDSNVGEGGFDGKAPWIYNDAKACEHVRSESEKTKDGEPRDFGSCLLALPTTPDGRRGTLWNAFRGRWGKAECTLISRICTKIDGPLSPGRQLRFNDPTQTEAGVVEKLDGYAPNYRSRDGNDTPRFPPKPWPPSNPATWTTPALANAEAVEER